MSYSLKNGMIAGLDETILAKEISASNQLVGGGNNHVLVVGGSGSGKTYSFLRPNIMQLNSSMVIIDQKGALRREMEAGLRSAGYQVEVIDFIKPERSTCNWNPLANCKTEQQVNAFCKRIVEASGRSLKDPYWQLAAEQLMRAFVQGIKETAPHEVPTFEEIFKKLDLLLISESYEGPGSAIDIYFKRLCKTTTNTFVMGKQLKIRNEQAEIRSEIRSLGGTVSDDAASIGDEHNNTIEAIILPPEVKAERDKRLARIESLKKRHAELKAEMEELREKESMLDFDSSKAYRLWKGVSTNARTTFSCVINQLHTSIAPFNTEALGGLMWSQESFDFRVLGRAGRPTALFIVCSDVSRELDPLVSTLEAQLFEELVRMADDEMDGELEQPVTFYLDDFASGTPLPDAPKLFANVRSRGIRMVAVIQSLSQLRRLYGADADSIVENCDVKVLMGGVADANALLYFNRGLEDRELAGMIARDTVLVFRKGLGARVSTRYDLTSHPNYEHFEEAKRAARGIADGLADGIIERVISESAHEESSRQKTDRSKREAE